MNDPLAAQVAAQAQQLQLARQVCAAAYQKAGAENWPQALLNILFKIANNEDITQEEIHALPRNLPKEKPAVVTTYPPNEANFEHVLSFATLRKANVTRMPLFKNALGEPAHSEPDGSDWSPAQWLQALVGEVGEYANIRKKFERGDITETVFLNEACKELADVQIYLDLLAFQLKIDLGKATQNKFNAVSTRVGAPVFLCSDNYVATRTTVVRVSTPQFDRHIDNGID